MGFITRDRAASSSVQALPVDWTTQRDALKDPAPRAGVLGNRRTAYLALWTGTGSHVQKYKLDKKKVAVLENLGKEKKDTGARDETS